MSQTREALDRLESVLARSGAAIYSCLADGCARDALRLALSSLPFEPCDDVLELYQWHDGVDVSRASVRGDEGWELAPSIHFPPLKQALTSYRQLGELARRITPLPGETRQAYWNEQWLPVFRSGSAAFVVSSRPEDRGVVWFLTWEQPALVAYADLAEMADRLRTWLDTGAVTVDAGGTMTPHFEVLERDERAYPYFW